jgi:hypothetical protein
MVSMTFATWLRAFPTGICSSDCELLVRVVKLFALDCQTAVKSEEVKHVNKLCPPRASFDQAPSRTVRKMG